MIHLSQFKSRTPATLLGLALDGSRLEGVVLRRTNGSVEAQKHFSATLSLDPLTADPVLVGAEIRNQLDAAGIHERHCAVCVPAKWALISHIELPDLPDADVASFLQIEAERGFPCDVATLRLASSRCLKKYALLLGIPDTHLGALERVLQAAKLKPLSFTLGLPAMQPPGDNGVLALAIGESTVELQVTTSGGVAALRVFEGALEDESGRAVLHADFVAREVRITLGELPAELRQSIRRVRVFGPNGLAQQLADELDLRLESLGLQAEIVPAVSPAQAVAERYLSGAGVAFEFLPPKVAPWQQVFRQYSSGRYRTVGAGAAALVVLVGGAFLIQQVQLWRLRSQWNKMSAQVTELDAMQAQIRQYRPWFDNSFHSLSILRQLTLAFPEDGAVSAKSVEIRDVNTVTCSGIARDNAALLRTLSQLRSANNVADLKVNQIRGKTPMQFVFDFRWIEGGRSEN
jgi:hypothetical protein